VQNGDVQRFDEILADDFLASNPTVAGQPSRSSSSRPASGDHYRPGAHDVRVRLMGDFAIIHARTSYTTATGEQRQGRYTDVWARRAGAGWRSART